MPLISSSCIFIYKQELHQQVRNLLPESSETLHLTYQVDGAVWRLVPDRETITVADFNIVPNCVLRSSYTGEPNESDP